MAEPLECGTAAIGEKQAQPLKDAELIASDSLKTPNFPGSWALHDRVLTKADGLSAVSRLYWASVASSQSSGLRRDSIGAECPETCRTRAHKSELLAMISSARRPFFVSNRPGQASGSISAKFTMAVSKPSAVDAE